MVDLVDTDRCESNGGGDLVAEDLCSGVSEVGVHELVRDDTVTEECLSVGKMCVGHASIRRCIVPSSQTEDFLCLFFQLLGV